MEFLGVEKSAANPCIEFIGKCGGCGGNDGLITKHIPKNLLSF